MYFLHKDIEYSLPDEWWTEAGMESYTATAQSFRAGPSPWPGLSTFQVAIDDVQPVVRQGTHGVFNDSPKSGTAHSRVVSILRGFRENSLIPPVEVARLATGADCRFKLIHGAHRFYCGVAAGFSHVPAVEVVDI